MGFLIEIMEFGVYFVIIIDLEGCENMVSVSIIFSEIEMVFILFIVGLLFISEDLFIVWEGVVV